MGDVRSLGTCRAPTSVSSESTSLSPAVHCHTWSNSFSKHEVIIVLVENVAIAAWITAGQARLCAVSDDSVSMYRLLGEHVN